MMVKKKDLKDLNAALEDTTGHLEQLAKFKDKCSAPLLTFVTQVKRKMTAIQN